MSILSRGLVRSATGSPLGRIYSPEVSLEAERLNKLKEMGAGLYPSEFTTRFVKMPRVDVSNGKTELNDFSFKGRRYLIPVYDTPSKNVLLIFGRQTEKSTSIGCKLLGYACLRQNFHSLYVSPAQSQTETFSRDKITAHIRNSERLRLLKGPDQLFTNNVLFKEFITKSSITFKYAFLSADRIRGISADFLCIDEFQDIDMDCVPVIEESLSHSPYKMFQYAGTPKSLDNSLNVYWSQRSTMNEWAIPCDACRHWNIPGIKNIGKYHLICDRCGKQIFSQHPRAQWASARSPEWLKNPPIKRVFEGFHIPQIIVDWISWDEILGKMEGYGAPQFYNEVLGMAFDNADRLLTMTEVRANCGEHTMEDALKYAKHNDVYFGIDWGTAEGSYTVLTVGGYMGGRFRVIYKRRYEGTDAQPVPLMADIHRLVREFNPRLIGTDYGGGYDRNDALIRAYGIQRVIRYQYCGAKRLYFDATLGRFMANKTEVVMAVINAIKRGGTFCFPKWEEMESPFASDYCAIFKEFGRHGERDSMRIGKTPGATDDSLHSLLYALLASMIHHPRPDIISPV